MKITIIGAGIGGLTTAIALEQKGFEVEIFESFPQMKRMGAGIVLANNAMKVYQRLGLKDSIYKKSNHISELNVVDENLDILSQIKLESFEKKLGVHYAAIHRGDLQELLLQNLKTTVLHLGKRLKNIIENEHLIQLFFEDRSSHKTDILIGADGIHSEVRKHFFPKTEIRNAKQVCWRGVTHLRLPDRYRNGLYESWGKGVRFGIVPLVNDEVYWFAVSNYKNDFRKEFSTSDLPDLFKNFNPIIQQLLESTPSETILTNELNDLKPFTPWHLNKVCLIGDAAHATTPNMGQGACQAIEDALALSICFEKENTPEAAFRSFQKIRTKKANSIISQSWQVGKLAHLENNIGRKIRNFLMRKTPSSIGEKQSAKIFELNY